MKKIILSLVVAIIFATGSVAFAVDNVDDSANYVQSEVYVGGYTRAAGQINYAVSSMTKGNNTLSCTAKTKVNAFSDKVGAYMVLQKWDGSKWNTYKTGAKYQSKTAQYNALVSFTVNSGTYRLVAYHRAYNGNSIFSEVVTTTDSITF